jgi:hypothetical protein
MRPDPHSSYCRQVRATAARTVERSSSKSSTAARFGVTPHSSRVNLRVDANKRNSWSIVSTSRTRKAYGGAPRGPRTIRKISSFHGMLCHARRGTQMAESASANDETPPGDRKASRPRLFRRVVRRIAAAKVSLPVFLIFTVILTAGLFGNWALSSLTDFSSVAFGPPVSGPSPTTPGAANAEDVPPGYSRITLPEATGIPDVGDSGWICSRSRYQYVGDGVTCFVPDKSKSAPPPAAAPAEKSDWTAKLLAISSAIGVLATAAAALGWRPFDRGSDSPKHSP